jgi:DNA-binding phage protein
LQQSLSSTNQSSDTTTAPQMARRETRSLLRVQMYHIIRRKMQEQGVGYAKLAKLTGIDKVHLRRSLDEYPERKLSLDRLLAVLYVLGYDLVFNISPREMSDNERQYLNASANEAKKCKPEKRTYSDARFPIRMVETGGPNRREETAAISTAS